MTRFFNVFCFGLFISVISLTSSAVVLNVSDNLIVSEIDDEPVENGFIGKKSTFILNQGQHALILRYKDVFEDLDFAEDRVVESKEFVVKFMLSKQQQVKITTVNIQNLQQAERFAHKPELLLLDENNKHLVLDLANVSDYKLAKQVNIAVSSLAGSATSIDRATKTSAVAASKMQTPVKTTSISIDSLEMLKYWWESASDTDKKRFQVYIE